MSIDFETIFEPKGELTDEIEDGLARFNMFKLGGWECHHIAVSARKDGQLIGGATGTAQWDWLQVELLWVEASEQRVGVGSQLLTAIERAAAAKGFPNTYLTTGSWQALGFYQKRGYDVFGQLEGYPKGHTTYFLKKPGSEATRSPLTEQPAQLPATVRREKAALAVPPPAPPEAPDG